MRIVPKSRIESVQFFQIRLDRWAEHAEEIGTSGQSVAALAAATAEARAAFAAQRAAMDAARSATLRFNLAVAEMRRLGAGVIKQVGAKAASAGDSVYPLASLPVPSGPSKLAAPGQPTRFTASLQQVGILTLRWRCKHPRGVQGVLYRVSRQTSETQKYVVIGQTGKRVFVDETVPHGVAWVMYQVVAVRSTGAGTAGEYIVHLGTGAKRPLTPPQYRPWQQELAAA